MLLYSVNIVISTYLLCSVLSQLCSGQQYDIEFTMHSSVVIHRLICGWYICVHTATPDCIYSIIVNYYNQVIHSPWDTRDGNYGETMHPAWQTLFIIISSGLSAMRRRCTDYTSATSAVRHLVFKYMFPAVDFECFPLLTLNASCCCPWMFPAVDLQCFPHIRWWPWV